VGLFLEILGIQYLVREKNSIFLELEKDKLKNYYFDLFLAIINDYNEYPNFIHIENILMIENFIIKHKNLFNEDIIFEYQESKKKRNNEKKKRLPNEEERTLLFYDNLFVFIKNIDLEKIKFLLIYISIHFFSEESISYVLGIILFLILCPLYLLFISIFSFRKKLYIDNDIYYNYFTYINKKIEFKLEKNKLIWINIICLILHILHLKNIFFKEYIRFSSRLYLIICTFLNILSIANYLIVLNILYRLTNSFQVFGATLDVIYGKNGNLIIPYKKRDKFGNYYIECRIIYFIIIFQLIYFIIIIKFYENKKRKEYEVEPTKPIMIENRKNIKISKEENNKNIKNM